MTPIDPEEIALFRWAGQLPAALWEDLAATPPELAAANCGAIRREGGFFLRLLGRDYFIDPAARAIGQPSEPQRRIGFQTGLVLLAALVRAKGVPPAKRMVTPLELPGGSLFFTGPHALPTRELVAAFGRDPSRLLPAALALGGRTHDQAEAAAIIPALPMIDLYVLLWAGDDEFPPSATLGIDAHAHHQLPLDAIWALCNVAVRRLAGQAGE
jgi:hypothetical protein